MADAEAPAPAPSKKRGREEEADDGLPEMPEKWAKKAPGAAMLWYYRDAEGKRQGPFYPGQMRQWWTNGFYKPEQLVAPSFKGEVPRTFVRIDQFYTTEVEREAAFVAKEGVALWPPARAERPLFDDPEADFGREKRQTEARPQWLEASIDRQRRGIKIARDYGPVERENYN